MKVHILRCFDLLCVNFEYGFTTCKVRQFYRNTAVKTAGTSQRRIKGFRAVCCCQNNNTIVAFKAVHLSQKLVKCLLTFIISADLTVTLFANGVNLINEDDTWSFFLGLLEEVTYFRCTHTNKHLDKFRTGHGEKRHTGFTGNSLGQHRFAGTRRSYKQYALGHGCTYIRILLGIMKIIYNLSEVLFCFILTGDIIKTDAVRRRNIDFGIAFSHTERQRIWTARLGYHFFCHILSESGKDQDWQNKCQKKAKYRRHAFFNISGKFSS